MQNHPNAAAYADLGTWFGNRKQFDCAAEAFAAAGKLQPKSASFAYMRGLSLFSAGEARSAIDPLRIAEHLDPSDIRSHLTLGAAFDQTGQTADAEKEWRAALAIDSRASEALDGLSQDLVKQKEYTAVIALLEQPGYRKGRSPQQSLNLGLAYARTAQLDKASEVLDDALKSTPGSMPLACGLADVLVLLERTTDAIAVLEHALAQHPDDLPTRLLYLLTLVSAHSEKAKQAARQLLVDAPRNGEVLYLNGLVEMQDGKLEQARSYLEQSVILDAKSARAHRKLGQVLLQLRDLPHAEEELKQAIALGDQEPEVYFNLAMVLRDRGQTDQARELLGFYLQLSKSRSDRLDAAGKTKMGDHAMASGDPTQAAAFYREALQSTPGDAILAYKLAMALDKSGDIPSEETMLEQAIFLNPNLAEAHNQRGYLAVRRGDTAQAESCYQAAVRASPSYVVAWINLAAALASEARWQEANDALGHALEIAPDNAKAHQLGEAIAAAQAQP